MPRRSGASRRGIQYIPPTTSPPFPLHRLQQLRRKFVCRSVKRIILLPLVDLKLAVAIAVLIFHLPALLNRQFDIETVVLNSAMSVPWQAEAGCPAHLRDVFERFVNGQNPALASSSCPQSGSKEISFLRV